MKESILRRSRNQSQLHYGLDVHLWAILGIKPTITTLRENVASNFTWFLYLGQVPVLYLSILEKKLLWCHTTEIQPTLPSEKGKKRKKKEFIVRFGVPWLDLMKNSKQKSKRARTFSPPLLSIPLTIRFFSPKRLSTISRNISLEFESSFYPFRENSCQWYLQVFVSLLFIIIVLPMNACNSRKGVLGLFWDFSLLWDLISIS